MKERIELLCKMLGVELEEEFMLEGDLGKYKITNEGIKESSSKSTKTQTYINVNYLLNLKVIKLPWKPKIGEGYYFLNEWNGCGYSYDKYSNHNNENMAFKRAEVYRTEEEAIATVKEKGWVVE